MQTAQDTPREHQRLRLISYGAGSIALLAIAGSLATQGAYLIAGLLVLLTGVWVAGMQRSWGWTTQLLLIGNIAAAVEGVWWGAWPPLMLVGVVATLIAWDLQRFSTRLGGARRVENASQVVREHLLRLSAVALPGLLLGLLAIAIHLALPFGVVLVLVLLAALGLIRALTYLRRTSI